ncbi:MAG: LysE family translocator [Alphaproteobacteria bacterium]
MSSLIALFIATLMLGLSPGPAMFATIGRALSQDLKTTYIFIFGIISGDLFFALLAMMGLAAIAAHYTLLFLIIKLIGGWYLIYLGIKNWKKAKTKTLESASKETGGKLFISGFLLTASNPKDLIFFISFIPAFMDLENAGIIEIVSAALIIAITFLITLSIYALSANRMKVIFSNEKTMTHLNRVAGLILIGVGLLVLMS